MVKGIIMTAKEAREYHKLKLEEKMNEEKVKNFLKKVNDEIKLTIELTPTINHLTIYIDNDIPTDLILYILQEELKYEVDLDDEDDSYIIRW